MLNATKLKNNQISILVFSLNSNNSFLIIFLKRLCAWQNFANDQYYHQLK